MSNKKMNDSQQEAFSAFIDNELTDSERNEQINKASSDVNMRYRMHRYSIIGDVMRGEASDKVALDFSAQVSAKIAQLDSSSSPVVEKEQVSRVSYLANWFKPLTGLAIAASVAWVAVISVQGVLQTELSNSQDQLAQTESQPQSEVSKQVEYLAQLPVFSSAVPVSSNVTTLNNQLQWSNGQSQAVSQSKLNAYLVTHTEYSSSMQGLIPQARVAGFDVNK